MELNAEQVKKALEHCINRKDCSDCVIKNKELGFGCLGRPRAFFKNTLALINSYEQKIKELTEKNERLQCVIGILERDVAERDEMLERKVEEVYPEFMRDYKLMQEELTELQKEVELDECQGT